MRHLLVTALAAGLVLAPSVVSDPDLWWHLRTGEWILANKQFPRFDPFSPVGPETPWIAYTWAFDLVLYAVHWLGGLTAICWLVAAVSAGVAAWVVNSAGRAGHSYSYAFAVTLVAFVALNGYATPRPWWCSIVGLICVLELERRIERSQRAALWLIILFAAWANLHIQFLYGLVALGLWTLLSVTQRAAIFVSCAAATLANPYGVRLYLQALDYARHASLSKYIEELRPPDLSQPYMVVTAIVGLAALAVFIRQKPAGSIWLGGLLLMGFVLFLRSRRDGWFLTIVAVWVLLEVPRPVRWQPNVLLKAFAGALGIALCLAGAWRVRPDAIRSELESEFPSPAAIRSLPASGSVFTSFDWGGYILWRHSSTSVTLDGRTNVHGVERTARLLDTWSGQRAWRSEPELMNAAAVIGPVNAPLTIQLRSGGPEFRLVYADSVTAVFARSSAR